MCNRYKAPSKPDEELSIETIKKLPPMYFTNITGGEPFIREDIKDIVRELKKKSDRIVISTNGFFTDRIIDLCEMKFSEREFTISKDYDAELRNKIGVFKEVTGTKKAVQLIMVTTFGVKQNAYSSIVQDEVTLDDLFAPHPFLPQ